MPALLAELLPMLRNALPAILVIIASGLGLWVIDRRLVHRAGTGQDGLFTRQMAMLALTGVAVILVVLVLPVGETTRGQLLGLLGLVLTAILAFSSTSFVANAMAGLMLRSVRSFAPGDFIKVADQFGRVTERGLFHTELQTEDRDLTTLPNLYLVTNPVTVVSSSGTIVSATISLGYDLAHDRIEGLLVQAAEASGLEHTFVHIVDLGDFSVTYRVAGFLGDVQGLLSTRSRLRGHVLDALHGAGVEIVSPTFMNQRQLDPERRFVPSRRMPSLPDTADHTAETLAFDKAERAALVTRLHAEDEALVAEIAALEKERPDADDAAEAVGQRIAARKARREALAREITAAQSDDS
jgi:small conductance mechanosensitive channel